MALQLCSWNTGRSDKDRGNHFISTPCTQIEVRSFLGYAGYYCRFINNFSKIFVPLYALTGNVEFHWSDKCDTTFSDLKKLVLTAPFLHGPNWELPFHISSDASDTTIGAVIGQEEDKKPYTIYYISRNLTPAKLNYTDQKGILGCHLCYK